MLLLGIESSCDDTSVALVACGERGCFVVAEKTASQTALHKKYGGVVPEIAGRAHAEKIVPLIEAVLRGKKPDVIAVTAGPGLITGLLVGVEAARVLSYAWNVPLLAVNHIEGHIYSVELENEKIKFPALALIASGGHTELIFMKNHGQHKLLGATRDDAAGECFDKVAKLLGLPYPGGPEISRLAIGGDPGAIKFPRPMIESDNYDFSFAGLKTAALYWLRDNVIARPERPKQSPTIKQGIASLRSTSLAMTMNDFCASFEQAIVDVLVAKTLKAARQYKPKTVILAGGVSANKKLRSALEKAIKTLAPITNFQLPISNYCMDNAAMLAVAGYYRAKKKNFTDWKKIQADPNWTISGFPRT
ncbi:tRNA (adenosine(37)-N6)-threonylcarbamoyltransferase complex transferase subunit TsaD [Patescibacteria group bacterium]|nr:MAG: tRNA (adenosine(37)-N6)-threonylcarbamoyltransferase complex transferase subunit TsaD [Patescibacteria group bacterium]